MRVNAAPNDKEERTQEDGDKSKGPEVNTKEHDSSSSSDQWVPLNPNKTMMVSYGLVSPYL